MTSSGAIHVSTGCSRIAILREPLRLGYSPERAL